MKKMKGIFAILFILGFTAAPLLLASSALAGPIDLVSSFPSDQGENGFYAERLIFYSGSAPEYQLLEKTDDNQYGVSGRPWNLPFVELVDFSAGHGPEIDMHPTTPPFSDDSEWAVYRWVVNLSGEYRVTGAFCDTNPENEPASTTVNIYKNEDSDTPLWSGSLLDEDDVAPFDITTDLISGDYLRFAVDAGPECFSDSTGLQGTINLVPVPGAIFLLGSGLLGLAGLRKKTRG